MKEKTKISHRMKNLMQLIGIIDLIQLIGLIFIATLLGLLFAKVGFPETNIVVGYIFAVLLVARLTKGYFYGVLASIVSILCYNYFFTEPYHTFAVKDPSYIITFCVMAVTALMTSALTTKEKLMTLEAMKNGRESQLLYQLSSQLSDAADIEDVIQIAAKSVSDLLKSNVGCMYVGKQSEPIYIQQVEDAKLHRNICDIDRIRKEYTNLRTEYQEDEESWVFPVHGQNELLALIFIQKTIPKEVLEAGKKLIHLMIENVSLALQRIEVTRERLQDQQRMEHERERANLLRAISHDLRTPLSGIMGSAEMLMDMTEKEDSRQNLLKGIYQDADWLKSLVENILSLTRLQDGKILIHKEMEALEEVIASAVSHVEKNDPQREILVQIPEDFILVPMDARLMGQVITNLLDNAVKHTTKEEAIEVKVEYLPDFAQITVQDEGEGIAKEDEGNLFQIFYTSKTRASDVRKGIGLGLTICETVVKAHGGTITGGNRKDHKGAEFIVTLPLTQEKDD